MKALVYEEYASDDDYKKILKIMDVPEPTPKHNEVVFKVVVAGLNHDDIWAMRGKPSKFQCRIFRELMQQEKLLR